MSIPLFFVIAFGWSWTFWGIPAVTGTSIAAGAGMTLFYLGLLGIAVAVLASRPQCCAVPMTRAER